MVSRCECGARGYVVELESSPGQDEVGIDLGSHNYVSEVDDVAKRPVELDEVSPGNSSWLAEPADVCGPENYAYRHDMDARLLL